MYWLVAMVSSGLISIAKSRWGNDFFWLFGNDAIIDGRLLSWFTLTIETKLVVPTNPEQCSAVQCSAVRNACWSQKNTTRMVAIWRTVGIWWGARHAVYNSHDADKSLPFVGDGSANPWRYRGGIRSHWSYRRDETGRPYCYDNDNINDWWR